MHQALLDAGYPDNVFDVGFHMYWPNGSDPFYLANTVDNLARKAFYYVGSVPTTFMDGTDVDYYDLSYLIPQRLAVPSPLWMDLTADINGTTINMSAKVVSNQNLSGNYVIHMILMDRYDYVPNAPNGSHHYYHPMRKMSPTASGQSFSAVAGDTGIYTASFTLNPAWSAENLDICAFIQNNTTKEVLQAKCEQVPLNTPNLVYQSNTVTDPNGNGRAEPGEACTMAVTLANGQYYQTATNVHATLSTADPALTITQGTSNYPSIPPGGTGVNQTPFAFSVSASAQPHTATLHLHVVADPLQTVYDTDFPIYVDFQNVLLVDDDGGSNFQIWYLMDLDSLGVTHEYWENVEQGTVPLSWIQNFDKVIWFTSNLTAPLGLAEQYVITDYLGGGGHLFITGEQIDEQFAGQPFYANTLHAVSLQSAGYFLLTGVAGDPISNGTTLNLVGGTGAGNNYSPNAISPGTGAYTLYTYNNSGNGGAIRWSSGNSKLVYMAFNFEAASGITSTSRKIVLGNILNWLSNTTVPVLDVTLTPISPPIQIPAGGGSFQFNATVQRTVGPQTQFTVWARDKYPDGSYTNPLLGPVVINPPVGQSVTRQRTQNVPGSWPAGIHYYIGYAAPTLSYPATDADSFSWTKLTTGVDGTWFTDLSCTGEPFPGEAISHPQSAFSFIDASPNPFNSTTAIGYQLSTLSQVSLKVYDTAGRLIATLVDGWQEAGTHALSFDGSKLASGIYLVKLSVGNQLEMHKIVLMK